MPNRVLPVLSFFLLFTACEPKKETPVPFDAAYVRLSPVEVAALPLAARFDPPLGGERGALTYNAQPFRVTRHLGDDLNGVGGWNSDLGDPVYAAGAGKVVYSGVPGPGWGNMLIVAHRVPDSSSAMGWRVYETIYAHLEERLVPLGAVVKRGQQIGKVGTANGKYLAHLHFEIHVSRSVYPGPGYSDAPLDRVSPERFVAVHGGGPEDPILPAP
jgi:murein DD-endopeptidase MepM/ murein hydrolase activator NlpD